MSQHDPTIRLRHMLDNAREAVVLLGQKTIEDVETDRLLQLALTRLVEVVGEAATKVPPETRDRYPNIPWREAASTRNVLIHGYDIVRYDILHQTISNDFPPLIEQLQAALGCRGFGSE